MKGRIWFAKNPWPEGHPLVALDVMGRVEPDVGLFLDVHLQTADYSSERDPDDADEHTSDWQAPIVWNNYHRCTLSSMNWDDEKGLLVATKKRPLDAKALRGKVKLADLAKHVGDSRALHVYLLGHDSVKSGDLRLTKQGKTYLLSWSGKLALTYAGDSVFRHRFTVKATGVEFTGFELPKGSSKADAEASATTFGKRGSLVAKKLGGRWKLLPA